MKAIENRPSFQLDFETNDLFHRTADNVDDLMRRVFIRLLSGHRQNNRVKASKGSNTEVFGALLELTDPRARLGRSRARARVFSPIGELMWYLRGSDALGPIQHYIDNYHKYSDDNETLNGAYGKRIFAAGRANGEPVQDEWQRVIETLRESSVASQPSAVVPEFGSRDCTPLRAFKSRPMKGTNRIVSVESKGCLTYNRSSIEYSWAGKQNPRNRGSKVRIGP